MFGLFCPAYVSEIHSCCISCLFLFICLPVLHYAKIKVLFIHSPANEYLGCFQFSTVMNTACHEHLCSHFCVAISFLLGIPRNEIECRCMLSFFVGGGGGGGFFYFLFIYFINYQIVSQSGVHSCSSSCSTWAFQLLLTGAWRWQSILATLMGMK